MTSTTLLPLHFATHLFSLTVAIAAAFVFARRTGRPWLARVAGALGFIILAAEQAAHGSALLTDLSPVGAFIRTTGYLMIAGSGLLAPGGSFAAIAVLSPSASVSPAASALVAGAALGWRSEREKGQLALAAGLVMLGAGESFLAVSDADFHGALFMAHLVRGIGWAIVAAGVLSATRRSIRFRYVTSFVAVLLMVVLAVSSALTRVIGDNLRREAEARVAQETDALKGRFEATGLDAIQKALTVVNGIRLAGVDSLPLVDLLRAVQTTYTGLDFLASIDTHHRLVAQVGLTTQAEVAELTGSAAVASALAGQYAATVDSLGSCHLVVMGAAQLRGAAGKSPGAVVVGFRVDDDLLGLLGPANTGFIVRGGTVTASTLPAVEALRATAPCPGTNRPSPGTPLPPSFLARLERQAIQRDESFTAQVSFASTQYFVSVQPLERTDGLVVGALVGAEPAEVLAATERGVNRVLFLVTLIAAAIAILLSSLFARRFTRPIRQLTAAARQVQAGDLTTKAPVTGEDEVGDLAVAFNRMTGSLSSATESLRQAVQEESRLRDQLETVLNSMGDGLIAADAAGKVLTFNPAAERISGLSRQRAVGRSVTDILTGRTRDGRALSSRDVPAAIAFLKRKDHEVPVAISSAPIKGGSGELLGRVYVIRDRSQEAEADRVKREFLATVSHELRTPLTPIVGYAELLTRREFDMDRVEEFARGILSSARRMERIVGMLLDYSAIEAGRMPVEPESVVLRPLVVRVVDEWRERAPSHQFVTRFAAGSPPAMVDVPLFRRTMDELLDNAVKYSPQGGTITVSVRPDGRINGKAAVQVEVADEGIGIPAKQLPGIFQDFRQLDGSDTRAYGGLGLGLAFVKRIVQAHRGAISAESRPGRGTTFKIGLPAAERLDKGK